MLDKNTIVTLTNRSNGGAGYTVPDLRVSRIFQSGESKEVTFEEVEKLSWLPGGKVLLQDYFIIKPEAAASAILRSIEPEYYYTKEDVHTLLTAGSLDQLLDALDFAPDGVIDLIKDQAVQIKLNDMNKRQAILDKTGYNVTKAIELLESVKSDEEERKAQPARRRAAAITETANETSKKTVRRTGNYVPLDKE